MENKTIYALLLGVLLVLGSCNDDASNQNPQDSQLDNDSFGEEENVLDVYPNHYGKNGDLVGVWAIMGDNTTGTCTAICDFSENGILRYYSVDVGDGADFNGTVLKVTKYTRWKCKYTEMFIYDHGELYVNAWGAYKVANLSWVADNQMIISQSSEVPNGNAFRIKNMRGYFNDGEIILSEPTGSIDGHDYVDLGLPSGTLWATCNVGADSPEAYGEYFAWGETTPKSDYSWSTYQYGNAYNQLTKYCSKSSYGKNGFTDDKTVLDAEDDAATVNWGGGWRMPTLEEMQELYNYCTNTWTTQNGVYGRKFTASNGNSIFLPAAGNYYESGLLNAASGGSYWSSSPGTNYPYYAYPLRFVSDYVNWDNYDRCGGRSVRPVVR